MKSNNYKKIKSALYNELNSSNYNYLFPDLIKKLINQRTLDNLIVHINNTKTITNTKCINNTKKEYLTGNEQFLILLENFINQFQNDFFFLNKTRDFPSFAVNQF